MTLEGLGADAVGVNCSLGPDELFPIVEEMAKWTTLPLVVKPNAGLPDPVTGEYLVDPAEFAQAVVKFAQLGVLHDRSCGIHRKRSGRSVRLLHRLPGLAAPVLHEAVMSQI